MEGHVTVQVEISVPSELGTDGNHGTDLTFGRATKSHGMLETVAVQDRDQSASQTDYIRATR